MPEMFELLLDTEVNPNACDLEGLIALHSSLVLKTSIAPSSPEFSADLNVRSGNGGYDVTALDLHHLSLLHIK